MIAARPIHRMDAPPLWSAPAQLQARPREIVALVLSFPLQNSDYGVRCWFATFIRISSLFRFPRLDQAVVPAPSPTITTFPLRALPAATATASLISWTGYVAWIGAESCPAAMWAVSVA